MRGAARRRIPLGAAVAAAALLLVGCAGAGSTISISFDEGDDAVTVTGHPVSVRCTDTSATGVSTDAPQMGITVHFGDGPRAASGSAWVHDGRIIFFEADELDIGSDDGRIRIDAAPGTVSIVEADPGEIPGSAEFDADDAVEVRGTLSVDLACDG